MPRRAAVSAFRHPAGEPGGTSFVKSPAGNLANPANASVSHSGELAFSNAPVLAMVISLVAVPVSMK